MKTEILRNDRVEDFASFCKKHRSKVDESFLYDEHLRNFHPDAENPTYIITNLQGEIVASASLIIDDYHKRGKKGRFRIFYSEVEDIAYYRALKDAILHHVTGLDYIFVFVQDMNTKMMDFFNELIFSPERYIYFLKREGLEAPQYTVPDEYEIKAFQVGKDEENWCHIRNSAFASLKGNDTPVTREMVTKMVSSSDYIDGGLMLIYHKDKPVGIIRGTADEFENSPAMNIGPIAILPEYQGRGLGRILLRATINFGIENNYSTIVLGVNAENEKARDLYIQEGFEQVEAVACYRYDIGQ